MRNDAATQEEPYVVATVVAYKSPQSAKPGSRAIIKSDGSMTGWIGGGCVQPIVIREAKKVLESGKPKLLCISPDASRGDWKGVEVYEMTCQGGGSLEIYLEPVLPKPKLVIIGTSPVAHVLSELGNLLDFDVCCASAEDATELTTATSQIDSDSYVVLATMGNGDEQGLEAVVSTNPKYLGLVASKEKARSLFQYIRDKGTASENLDRIKSPAGLELGSETLAEIALSVMAEVVRIRRVKQTKTISLPIMQKVVDPATEAVDPICGMTVQKASARYTTDLDKETYYFCCPGCKARFEKQHAVGGA